MLTVSIVIGCCYQKVSGLELESVGLSATPASRYINTDRAFQVYSNPDHSSIISAFILRSSRRNIQITPKMLISLTAIVALFAAAETVSARQG